MNERFRLTIDITEEQQVKLFKILPYGVKKLVLGALIDDLLRIVEASEDTNKVLGLIISGDIRLTKGSANDSIK